MQTGRQKPPVGASLYPLLDRRIVLILPPIAIEVMASKETRPDIISLLMEQCKAHGFSPFHVKKDSNGYIYNRWVFTFTTS
jgi:hypothetical protein